MLSKFFIERPILANVIAIITIILGIVCLWRLPVAQYPEIVPPVVQVNTRYPGASAEVIANTVGIPIEQAVNGVENALYYTSTSGSDGSYTLNVTFAVGTDLNTSMSLVQNMVNKAMPELPGPVQSQGLTVKKVSTNILLVVSLYSQDERFDPAYLSNYGMINLQYPLGRLDGVGNVQVFGAGQYSMRVWLDPNKLQTFELTTLDVVDAIQRQNIEVVAGQMGGPPVPESQVFQFTVNALGRLTEVSQFEDIIVKSIRGEAPQVVRVRDIARVELSQQLFINFGGLSGKKSAQILIYPLPGANSIAVAEEVRQAVAEMSKSFPEGLTYVIEHDTTKFIQQAIHAVYETLFEAGILVLVVIMVFLQNWRATLVPATTVPVTIIGAFAAMALLGFTVNLMTLFALILAIGIVVDDAIVIVENASYYLEQGLSPKDAAIKTMEEMTGPVIGITLVLTSVFLPAAFLPGINGQLFRQFALVIASTAVISALNALTLKPVQCAQYLKPRGEKKVGWFYCHFNQLYAKVEAAYMAIVTRMVHHPKVMLIIFFSLITVTGFFFVQHPTGFLPDEDQGYAIVTVRLPEGAAQPRVEAVSRKVNAILKETPGIRAWVTVGGLSLMDSANLSNTFSTFAIYEEWDKRGADLSQEKIIADLNRRLSSIEEAYAVVLTPPPITGLGQAGGFQMMVEDRGSLGLAELQKATNELIQAAGSQSGLMGLATTFSARSPQIYLDIDRTKVESMGVPLGDVFATLQAYLGSTFVNLFNKFDQSYQVYVQADAPFRLNPDDVKNLYVRNQKGEMTPLGTMMSVHRRLGSELVTRYNLYPAAQVFGAAAPGFSSGEAIDLMEQVAQNVLPKGMAFDWTATAFQEKLVGSQAYFIYALSIILVFLVLSAQYESWFHPAAVILVVPTALVGVLIGLNVRGYDNDLYTQVGLVLMIALASKNAILVVEFARELKEKGLSTVEAAIEATRRRLRPIIMTSFAFILGVAPLLLAGGAGAASQRAIGTVVFGGMISSTLVAIPFVPVFYVVMEGLSERLKSRKQETGIKNKK
ncbi:MAG TPA: hydrophobe/amphiphile efflux-1 family RND transporter [Desulfobacterales bacterium]|nr:hydrophobe/amphiphile efflux-1 family RND transporter [Desulfobacterales bacterium]